MPAGPGRDQLKPMERLAHIMAVLHNAGSVGATRDRLFEVADYGDADPGTQLNKDLSHLRKQGWQIDNIAGAGEPGRYRMVSGDNRLRLRLNALQLAALQRAVILADRSDLSTRLSLPAGDIPEGLGVGVLPHDESIELTRSFQALQLRSLIRFSYKGTPRKVHPGSVRFQNGQWYLSGLEDGDADVKHFVVGRMSDVSLDKPGSARTVPAVRQIPLHPLRWQMDEPTQVVLRTSAEFVPDVIRWLMEPDSQVENDGQVDMTYTITHRAALRSRLYFLGTRVSIVGPDEVRDELVAELRELVG